MLNKEIIDFLLDIHSIPDVILFCEMQAEVSVQLANPEDSTDEHWYNYTWYTDMVKKLKAEYVK